MLYGSTILELVKPEENMKIVRNKWVYKIKYNPNRIVSRYKVRLVAKVYHPTVGVDNIKTFNLVVKNATVKMIMIIVVIKG